MEAVFVLKKQQQQQKGIFHIQKEEERPDYSLAATLFLKVMFTLEKAIEP